MTNKEILEQIKGGLIVSCQALETEPLYDSYIMSKMAWAAYLGGAVGIRANTVVDIKAIKEKVDLPVIGIIKQVYEDSDVYITPTMKEFFTEVRAKYPNQLFMADTSCFEEGKKAEELGMDLIGTTMAGYTPYTKGTPLPDFKLMERYVKELHSPVIAEGGIWVPEQLKQAIDTGVHAAVVGTAITRPMDITKHFIEAIK